MMKLLLKQAKTAFYALVHESVLGTHLKPRARQSASI